MRRRTLIILLAAVSTALIFHVTLSRPFGRPAVSRVAYNPDSVISESQRLHAQSSEKDTPLTSILSSNASSFAEHRGGGHGDPKSTRCSGCDHCNSINTLDLEEIRNITSRSNGFYARDYSLWLGWNNVRHIFEASLLHAYILNRTLILPSFVYARACEFEIGACAAFADMVNRNDAFGLEQWRGLPLDQQMGWRIPISTMIDLPHLRRIHPVITVSEYLRLHGLPETMESMSGSWNRELYHSGVNIFAVEEKTRSPNGGRPTLYVIRNEWYDPKGVVRVDCVPEEMKKRGDWNSLRIDESQGRRGQWDENRKTRAYVRLQSALPEGREVLEWWQARAVLMQEEPDGADQEGGDRAGKSIPRHLDTNSMVSHARKAALWDVRTDERLESVLKVNGWEVLYTYEGAVGVDYLKTVTEPIRQVAPRSAVRGLVDDFSLVPEDVVLLEGEVHLNRKPGNIRFTTHLARTNFTRMVLNAFKPTSAVLSLAELLDARMREKTAGHMWMGAHMRRGDFVTLGWAMENSTEAHFERIRAKLDAGRRDIHTLRVHSTPITFDVPDIEFNRAIWRLPSPEEGDPFFLATDERSEEGIQYMSQHGAVLINDLLTTEDRRLFGWPLMLTDMVALVEQALLARASYFYAHALSSVAGGVINMRAARGADPRTSLID